MIVGLWVIMQLGLLYRGVISGPKCLVSRDTLSTACWYWLVYKSRFQCHFRYPSETFITIQDDPS